MDLFNSSVKRGDVNIRPDGMNPGHVAPACNYKGALMAQCGGGGKIQPASWMEPWRSGSFEVAGGQDIRRKIENKHKASKAAC